jgi:hypothetical protein
MIIQFVPMMVVIAKMVVPIPLLAATITMNVQEILAILLKDANTNLSLVILDLLV